MSLGEVSISESLGDLQGKGDKFTRLSLMEKKRQMDLTEAINYIQSETDKFRSKAKQSAIDVMNIHVLTPNPAYSRADGVNIGKEAQIVTTKTLVILEAKLNKLLQRKSELQNHIKKMKETINHYRLLRTQTDAAHARFEETLAATKANIEHLLGESTKIVEERERTVEKKDALERLNKEEQQKFFEEYEEMGRFIKEQNEALELALLQERKEANHGTELSKGSVSGSNSAGNNDPNEMFTNIASDLSLEEEIEMARKVGSLNTFMNQEQSSLADLRKKIATYETMFEQLKKMTGVESLEDMVSNYIAHEEEMFSSYNFIQTMNTEIDTVLEATTQTEEAIAKFKEDQQDQDQQRRSAIDELQQRLASTLEITRDIVDHNAIQQESLTQISKKVSSVFFKLQCDQMDTKGSQVSKAHRYSSGSRPDSKVALLTGQGVTESNVMDYLGCIEQRAVDIITEYLHLHSVKDTALGSRIQAIKGGGAKSPTPGPPTPMNLSHRREPLVDIADISDDEFLQAVETADTTNNNGTQATNINNNTPFFNSLNTAMNTSYNANNLSLNNSNMAALAPITNNTSNNANNNNTDHEFKPVDLNAFKSKLVKKLGLKESSSTPSFLGVGTGRRRNGTRSQSPMDAASIINSASAVAAANDD